MLVIEEKLQHYLIIDAECVIFYNDSDFNLYRLRHFTMLAYIA